MATSKVYLGIAVELAGKTIALEPKNAIDELKTKGIEVELPPGERVYLGTAGGGVRSIMDTLDVDKERAYISEQGNIVEDNLPDIQTLKNLANTLTEARLYVEEFHIRIPGSGAVFTDAQTAQLNAINGKAPSSTITAAEKTQLQEMGFSTIDLSDPDIRSLVATQVALAEKAAEIAAIDALSADDLTAQVDTAIAALPPATANNPKPTVPATDAKKRELLKELKGFPTPTSGYTLAMSAEWGPGQGKLVDNVPLELRGIYLKVTNEE